MKAILAFSTFVTVVIARPSFFHGLPSSNSQEYEASSNIQSYGSPFNRQRYGSSSTLQGFGSSSNLQGYGSASTLKKYGSLSNREEYGSSSKLEGYGSSSALQGYGTLSNIQRSGSSSGISSSLPQQVSRLGYASIYGLRNSNNNIYNRLQLNNGRDENEEIHYPIKNGLFNSNARSTLGLNLQGGISTSAYSSIPYDTRIINTVQHKSQIQKGTYGLSPLQSKTSLTPTYPNAVSSGVFDISQGRYIGSSELNSFGPEPQLTNSNLHQNNDYSQKPAGSSDQLNDQQWAYGTGEQANIESW